MELEEKQRGNIGLLLPDLSSENALEMAQAMQFLPPMVPIEEPNSVITSPNLSQQEQPIYLPEEAMEVDAVVPKAMEVDARKWPHRSFDFLLMFTPGDSELGPGNL